VRATDGWAVLRVSQGSRDDHLIVARTRHAVHRWVRCCWHHGSEIERRSRLPPGPGAPYDLGGGR
jgi:hypothetical protein